MNIFKWLLTITFLGSAIFTFSQNKIPRHLFHDSVDTAFDISNFLIDAKGFIPIPFVITEPALGGFGGGLGLVFIRKRPPYIDSIRSKVRVIPVAPDVTGGAAMYTANDTWGMMGFRSGTLWKLRTKYRIIAGYANINLSFYHTLRDGEDREFKFNFKTIPVSGHIQKKFKGTFWSAGIQYMYLQTQLELRSEDPPDFLEDEDIDGRISMPGILTEFDNRDNVFTPDKGLRFYASSGWSDGIFASDYDYVNITLFTYGYQPFAKNVIGALRLEFQQVFEDPPFYLVPFINMRGIPTARYQGNIISLVEGEVRWDFVPRWSAVGFAGTGKAFDTWSDFDDNSYIWSGGTGVRYLLARKFKLRIGMDVSRGPEQWAYYFVFGSAWLK